jgi:diaminopimelate epimerase
MEIISPESPWVISNLPEGEFVFPPVSYSKIKYLALQGQTHEMRVPFYKYHGTGNDFILIDNRTLDLHPGRQQVEGLCDRHFGIGADGLILLTTKKGYDFGMVYFNSDGLESTMCGNGGRCLAAFANSLGIVSGKAYFHATDGDHEAVILAPGRETMVSLKMKDVHVDEIAAAHLFINTGSPHYILFVKDAENMDILADARKIRFGERFSEEGTNVDFVEIRKDHLFVRSYERGVEDETYSCGTGVTASALAVAIKNPDNPGFFRIRTRGGELRVRFRQEKNTFTDVWLEGPATAVFSGELEYQ